ncbi:MAG: hypothetical protein ACYC55_00090 [Candidatus Geothermincolia bacterium]
MALNGETGSGRSKTFIHFTLVGLGIPLILGASVLVFELVADRRTDQSAGLLYIIVAALALVGLGIWAFFSFFMFGRLWKVFERVSSPEKMWEFIDGTYLLIGVGISLIAAIGVFYYIFTADVAGAAALVGLAGMLYLLEVARFSGRVSNITRRHG